MSDLPLLAFSLTVIAACVPLLLAATGELVVERAGVLNLGIEGMMLVGAVVAFAVAIESGSFALAAACGAGAGATLALLFAALALGLRCSQVAVGLALTIFGTGLSTLIGVNYVGRHLDPLAAIALPSALQDWSAAPLFTHNAFVWFALALILGVHLFLFRTRAGLVLRAVGESHDAARALGHPVFAVRTAALVFGGCTAGLAGAYISLAYTPLWSPGLTAGRGWIALALVVFSAWRPSRLLFGTLFFGAVSVFELYSQGFGFPFPPQFLAMLPYAATILALAVLSAPRGGTPRLEAPGSLARTFSPEGVRE